jgi:hypothetical protein
MRWLNVHIPRLVAEEVGRAAVRSGVGQTQAIAAALWIFSRLPLSERAAVIREYLSERGEQLPARRSRERGLTRK